MDVKKFEFKFKHAGKIFTASCQVSKPGKLNYPQYRVHVPEGKWGEVYVFYLLDEKTKTFFSFQADLIAKSIEKALNGFKETPARKTASKAKK